MEVKLVRKNIELKKLITDVEKCSYKMFHQNQQIRESMEIERAHAKRERAESEKHRLMDREIILDILKKEKDHANREDAVGIKVYNNDLQNANNNLDTYEKSSLKSQEIEKVGELTFSNDTFLDQEDNGQRDNERAGRKRELSNKSNSNELRYNPENTSQEEVECQDH